MLGEERGGGGRIGLLLGGSRLWRKVLNLGLVGGGFPILLLLPVPLKARQFWSVRVLPRAERRDNLDWGM